MGVDAVRAGVKACLAAANMGAMRVHALMGRRLVILPRWAELGSHGRRAVRLELCFRLGIVEEPLGRPEDDDDPLVASKTTNVGMLAGAIFKRHQSDNEAVIIAKGGQAILNVIKASIVAETYLKRSLQDSQFGFMPEGRFALLPSLAVAQRANGSNFTFVRFRCVALDESLYSPGQPMSRL